MNPKLTLQFLTLAIALLFVGCGQEKEPVAMTGVTLSQTYLTMTEGDTQTLSAIVQPSNASNKNVTWTSSNPEIATVDNGNVTAVKAGTTTITVTTVDGAKTAKCEVTVLYGKPNEAIIFADEIMKGMCVKAFDTNGDGELSFLEASKVTDLEKMMLTNKTFSSFDEFQYFTSVDDIPNGYFENCRLMTSIVLPESLRAIFYNAFSGCSNLKQIVIPENVKTIVAQAFSGCSDLESVILPSRLETIQQATFFCCSSLTSINIPAGVTRLENVCFYGCSSLTSIVLPEGVTSLGYSCFSGCSSLSNINIPAGVTRLGNGCFYGCSSLTSVVLPEGVTSLESDCFSGCSSLSNINIPEGVTSIGDWCFNSCI